MSYRKDEVESKEKEFDALDSVIHVSGLSLLTVVLKKEKQVRLERFIVSRARYSSTGVISTRATFNAGIASHIGL